LTTRDRSPTRPDGGDGLGKVAGEPRRRGVTVDGDVVRRRGAFGPGPSLDIRALDGYRLELKPR
jgi:hypothetical protein